MFRASSCKFDKDNLVVRFRSSSKADRYNSLLLFLPEACETKEIVEGSVDAALPRLLSLG